MESEEYAVVILPGGGAARVWPTGGRAKESFEAHCATCGVTVIGVYPSVEVALEAISLPIGAWLAVTPVTSQLRRSTMVGGS